MAVKFDKKQFKELAKQIKTELKLDINTQEELDQFAEKQPEQYQLLLEKVKKALNESVVGGTFEELDIEQMEVLQGAGDVNAETSPFCIAAGVTAGIALVNSLKRC